MNILVTSECNRKCAYCFAKERISFSPGEQARRRPPKRISRADFASALALATRSRLPVIGVLGGEPSMHPELPALLADAWAAGIDTKLFTNGLWPDGHLEAVAAAREKSGRRLSVIVNVNEEERSAPGEHDAQERLLATLATSASLSFNISRPEFDGSFLVRMIDRCKTRRGIRLGVAQPLAEIPNEHIDVAEYARMVPSLLRLAEECDRRDVALGFDCGFTMCMFTAEQLGRLLQAGASFKAACGPAVDVGTDLSVWACFPLSGFSESARMTDFATRGELARHFRRQFKRLYRTGALPECVECRFRRRGQCAGGCAAHVYRRLSP
jgi:radical SAM protein with 4Fe4S-binding SPASM domain